MSSSALALQTSAPLTPAMLSVVWELSALLDEQHVPATIPNAVWLEVPTRRLRGEAARQDNVWLRECLERLTTIRLGGETRNGDEWGAVLVAEWHIEQRGSMARILVPPVAVHALRAPTTFAKIEIEAAHRLPPHARRLYGLLADRKRQREPWAEWPLPRLRALLGVDDKRTYEVWAQFHKWVLKPAVEAINDFGTVDLKMTPKKLGRTVKAVRFEWRWKDPLAAHETSAENDRHSAARGKDCPDHPDAPPLVEEAPDVVEASEIAALTAALGLHKRAAYDDENLIELNDGDRPIGLVFDELPAAGEQALRNMGLTYDETEGFWRVPSTLPDAALNALCAAAVDTEWDMEG